MPKGNMVYVLEHTRNEFLRNKSVTPYKGPNTLKGLTSQCCERLFCERLHKEAHCPWFYQR